MMVTLAWPPPRTSSGGRSDRRCARFREERRHEAHARRPERVAEGDGPTVHVHPRRVRTGLFCQASTTEANASLISTTSMSAMDSDAFFKACAVAGMGALSIEDRVVTSHAQVVDARPG